MKILFCIDSLRKGGAERVVSNLSNYLVGHNEIVILTMSKSDVKYALDNKIKVRCAEGNEVFSNKLSGIRVRVSNTKKVIREFNPDVILAFLPYSSLVTTLANLSEKRKLIVSVRNDPKTEYRSLKYWYLKKFLYPRVDGFVMQTDDMRKYFSQNIQRKSIVIPNPLNPLFLNSKYGGARTKRVVSVGKLYEQKNQKLLINAYEKVSEKYPDYKLMIYGEGPLRQQLENQIKELDLENKVELCGEVNDVKSSIQDASCFVLSSDYEGMPNALMEAMALGLPVVSTDCPCGGPKYLIKHGKSGILVKVGNSSELSEAIMSVLGDKKKAKELGDEAAKISEWLSPDKINYKWEDYIKRVFKNEK